MPENFEISDQEVKWSYWYVTHREQIRRAGIIALVVVCIGLWGYSLTRLAYLFFIEEPKTQAAIAALPQDLVHVQDRSRYEVAPLEIVEAETFNTPDGSTDFYARLMNPNTMYAATFTVTFVHEAGETAPLQGFILPGSEQVVTLLGVPQSIPVRNAQPFLDAVSWKRVVGWERREAEQLDLVVSDISVEPLSENTNRGSRIAFTVTNRTTYNFWSVEIPIVLLRGARVSGVNTTTVPNLMAGERRPISLQWFGAPQDATTVKIVPQVNVLDPATFQAIK